MGSTLQGALEKIDLGMYSDAANDLRELSTAQPEVNPVIEKLDFGDNDGAADALRHVLAGQAG